MNPRNILFPCLGLAAGAVAQDEQRPNVIFLMADDLGYGDLSCYGATRVNTPNVDSIARNGIRFTECHAVASTSTPSRYSVLTGEYCFRRHGTDIAAGNAGMIIKPEQYTVADLFRNAG
ncbi:MAG: sulfatase-like hydrolase/transferase, partial [Prevotella sp.]|nr:sulfatase-like hydrolase/transferase [Prevotella sp.]